MERTFRRRVPPPQLITPELAAHLAGLSFELGRQVGVLLTREGSVRNVIVGDALRLEIPEIGRSRAAGSRLRGLRLVHTHLKGEPLSRDDLNDLVLLRLDVVATIAVGENGSPGRVELAHVLPESPEGGDFREPFLRIEASDLHRLQFDFAATIRSLEQEFARISRGRAGETGKKRALLVSVAAGDEHFQETAELVRAAGVVLAGSIRQRRRGVHPKTIVGKGKLDEIVLESMRRQADLAIFDVDLKPAQARAFEAATGLKSMDRTQLILDIFAQRARSRDGKLQVELARLKYALPRLTDADAGLSRLSGKIGSRGPGETVLEISRRRVRDRIQILEKQVQALSRQRSLRREKRRHPPIPVLSIIGYTNAGKSTLLNALTASQVPAADQLFVTLDPTSRRLRLPGGGEVIVTDTVGFLSDLPEDLVSAFRATLEELEEAYLLLHVVDASDEHLDSKRESVRRILLRLGLGEIPRLLVLNKVDLLDRSVAAALARRSGGVPVSAVQHEGLGLLLQAVETMLEPLQSRSRGSGQSVPIPFPRA